MNTLMVGIEHNEDGNSIISERTGSDDSAREG
jgi:hypothetical protein